MRPRGRGGTGDDGGACGMSTPSSGLGCVAATLTWPNSSGIDDIAQHLAAGTGGSIVPNWVTWTVSIVIPIAFILLVNYFRHKSEPSDTEELVRENKSELPSVELFDAHLS